MQNPAQRFHTPENSTHRRYEALRALFVDHASLEEAAAALATQPAPCAISRPPRSPRTSPRRRPCRSAPPLSRACSSALACPSCGGARRHSAPPDPLPVQRPSPTSAPWTCPPPLAHRVRWPVPVAGDLARIGLDDMLRQHGLRQRDDPSRLRLPLPARPQAVGHRSALAGHARTLDQGLALFAGLNAVPKPHPHRILLPRRPAPLPRLDGRLAPRRPQPGP